MLYCSYNWIDPTFCSMLDKVSGQHKINIIRMHMNKTQAFLLFLHNVVNHGVEGYTDRWVRERNAPSFLSVSRRVTVAACESAHNWIGALERGL